MKLPRTYHNLLSYAGTAIAALAFIVFGFLAFLHTVTGAAQAPYAGLVIFIFVPAVLVFGLMLIPIGMRREWHRIKRTGSGSVPQFPVIDLNQAAYRNAVFIGGTVALVVLFSTIFGSFQAYEATESVAFCGRLCHAVMQPEYTAYQDSPHARVRCVECHVGPGADWFVKSKVTGLYQVYAVTFHKYPQPIPAPIESLRPAQETCEQCHWPEQFFGGKERTAVHFLPDEKNSRWEMKLLVKIGGGTAATGQSEGIHMHMNIGSTVEYIAVDEKRQQIPWVRITRHATGETIEYMSTEAPLTPEQIASAPRRQMDCMDCHNRPSHIFRSPSYAMNAALNARRIDASLPFIKQQGVELLAAKYTSESEALLAISQGITRFYQNEHPDVLERNGADIVGAIAEIQRIYQRNFFPYMGVRWDVYPDNIGHMTFLGCHRCHDGAHKSADGKVITAECTACHTILAQGPAGALRFSTDRNGLEFEHPGDVGELWKQMPCSSCHTGASP